MAEGEGIGRSRYSAAEAARGDAHARWSERGWPSIAALFKSTPIGPFATSADDFSLNGVIVSYASGTARVLERTPERIAADGIDILGVGLLIEGAMDGLAASREFQLGAGGILLLDLSQPITMTMSDSRSVQVAIPRALAEAELGQVAALHGTVVAGAAARRFHDHVIGLRPILDTAADDDAPRLAAALVASLAQTLRAVPEEGTP